MARYVSARVHVAVAGILGVVAYGVAAFLAPWQIAVLVGWDVTAASLLMWLWWSLRGADSDETARLAKTEDLSPPLADLVLVAASVASLGGIGFALFKASGSVGTTRALITVLAVVTVALSWLSVHAVYVLRYADLYYGEGGGIDFHEDRSPDYGDFAYVAFTIGMTYQVSDFDLVSRRIRMTALRHGLLSFLFGIAVISVTISVVANLLKP
jgi:uncharacterized membrane protein